MVIDIWDVIYKRVMCSVKSSRT